MTSEPNHSSNRMANRESYLAMLHRMPIDELKEMALAKTLYPPHKRGIFTKILKARLGETNPPTPAFQRAQKINYGMFVLKGAISNLGVVRNRMTSGNIDLSLTQMLAIQDAFVKVEVALKEAQTVLRTMNQECSSTVSALKLKGKKVS